MTCLRSGERKLPTVQRGRFYESPEYRICTEYAKSEGAGQNIVRLLVPSAAIREEVRPVAKNPVFLLAGRDGDLLSWFSYTQHEQASKLFARLRRPQSV